MKLDTIKQRLAPGRPIISVTLRMPQDVIDDLKRIAPMRGFTGYQALMRSGRDCAKIGSATTTTPSSNCSKA